MTKEIKAFNIRSGWWQAVYISPVSLPFLWVAEDTFINFKGYNLLLRPAIDDAFPSIYLNTQIQESAFILKESINVILEFLSSYAWISEQQFEIHGTGGSQLPIKYIGCKHYIQQCKSFYFENVPEIIDEKERLTLAIYREATSIRHPAFQFLSFYKIINLAFPIPAKQMEWINNSISLITDQQAKERIKELCKTESNIGKYLYVSCRCAIAHATIGKIVINPDDYNDYRRLYRDICLIQELSKIAIQKEFNIKSRFDIHQEHLYELSGFKTLFSKIFLDALTKGKNIQKSDFPKLPNLSIRLKGHQKFELFENLEASICGYGENILAIECFSNTKLFKCMIFLNFKEERLQSDWLSPESNFLGNNNTPESCDRRIEFLEFQKNYLLNGILEVWEPEEHKLLGHCDAFMPVNCFVNTEWYDQEIANMNSLKEERLRGINK